MWIYNTELYHHGIKGQKWGVRRFQNEDGTLTAAGEKRYRPTRSERKEQKKIEKAQKKYDDSIKKNYVRIYNKTADWANAVLIPQINAEYGDRPVNVDDYIDRFNKKMGEIAVEMFGDRPV